MSDIDDGNGTDPKQFPDPRPETAEGAGPAGWLDALNAFLERANKADLDTGC